MMGTVSRERRVGRGWPALDDERDDALSSMVPVPRPEASSREEEERGMDPRAGASEGAKRA